MKTRTYNPVILTLALIAVSAVPPVLADPVSREEKIKAAFIYNFLNFVDWPSKETVDSNDPITIGVIGSRDFLLALKPVEQKKSKNRSISVKYFAGYEKLKKSDNSGDREWNEKIEALKVCDALLLCTCDFGPIESSAGIVKALGGSPILTVGETDSFVESGGIISFVMEDEKVRFEINNVAAKRAKLKIRSKLLRLAKRVIEEDAPNGTKK